MKSKIFLFFALSIGFMSTLTAQVEPEKSDFWEKVRFGGNFGLDFTNNTFSILLGPSAVYQVNEKFSAGAGIDFGYSNFRNSDTKQTNYGARLIGLYNPTRQLQISAELEQNFVNRTTEVLDQKIKDSFNFPSLYLGAGYRLGNISAGIRYDVLYNENGNRLYSSPWSPFVSVWF